MELYELTQNFKEIFCFTDLKKSPEIIKAVVLGKKYDLVDKWLRLCPDLSKDYLQMIFQYYMADRKEKMQDYTPSCLGKLCANLLNVQNAKSCYDMCAGSGSLTVQVWNLNKDISFICEELDENVIPFLLLNLLMRNVSAVVINGNILTGERFIAYKVTRGEKYSQVQECEPPFVVQTDICLSNPPYNLSWEVSPTAIFEERFADYGMPEKNNANYVFILNAVNASQKCSLILPNSITEADTKILENLIRNNIVDSIIINPNSMFEKTDIGTCVLTLNKNRKTRAIEMIDCRKTNFIKVGREQRGQFGGTSHTDRVYTKINNEYTDENIGKILEYISERKTQAGFSRAVYFDDLQENGFVITPSRYIGFEAKEGEHRQYKDIINDWNKIIKARNTLKLVINETLAKQLGLDIVHYAGRNNDISKQVKAISGVDLEKDDYIQLTKNKGEFIIKVNSKDIFPETAILMFNMWKQNAAIYNSEENIILAEYRDALLPDLMSGKIDVSGF